MAAQQNLPCFLIQPSIFFSPQSSSQKKPLQDTTQILCLCLYKTMHSRLSDPFRANPMEAALKPHDFSSLRELPDSFTWAETPLDAFPADDPYHAEPVPVVDLRSPDALLLVRQACQTWGVFQAVNHGVPSALLRRVEEASRSLFALPLQQKLKAARSPDGVSGYGFARISSFFSKLMWSEGFTIAGSPLDHFRQLWPQDEDRTKYCDVVKEYEEEMKKLATRLMWLVLGSLDITKEDLKWAGPEGNFPGSSAALQLNHYPACPDPGRAMGLAAHTDSTLLTVLYQSNTSGLQVLKDGGGWVTVPSIPGRLVVHVGDLLHILSNGLYTSVIHRAVVNRNQPRFSIAYLYGPPSNVQISPLCKLINPSRPALYRPITWTEYLTTKAKHFNKALSSVRICAPLSGLVDANKNDHNSSVTVG